jgi:ATP-binding cassette subfamily F protein uup
LVDHVFVFNGTGMVKDYPGNYTQYIEWSEKQKKTAGKIKEGLKPKISKPQKSQNKLTYSERLEYEQLEKEIEGLTTQKSQLEDQLNSGELSNDQIIDASKQIGELLSEIELKELRWFELAEKLDE